jgi:hypothetical protein
MNQCSIEVLVETGFSTRSVPWSYKEDDSGDLVQFCTEVCEERLQPGDSGIAIVGAITRKHLITD